MESLEEAILWHEERSLIHDAMGLGDFAEMALTSDGAFIGRRWGEREFTCFLGLPTERAQAHSRELFHKLSLEHQSELIRRLQARGIPPAAVGIPEPQN